MCRIARDVSQSATDIDVTTATHRSVSATLVKKTSVCVAHAVKAIKIMSAVQGVLCRAPRPLLNIAAFCLLSTE